MSSKKSNINCAALLGTMTMVLVLAVPASATILTMQAAGVAQYGPMPQDYGDNASGSPDGSEHQYLMGNGWTPNIAVSYSSSNDPVSDMLYYSDAEWDEVIYLYGGEVGVKFWATLTPEASYKVKINSFVLDDYPGSGGHTVDWTIYADDVGGSVLANGTETTASGEDALVPVTMSAYNGAAILEIVKTAAVVPYSLALDSLNFDQAVPEPTSLALLGLAGLTLLQRRRRK